MRCDRQMYSSRARIGATGNFYSNVTLRAADTEAIVQTLTSLRRRAFVAPAIAGSIVVFDQAIEDGGSRELSRFAAGLSRRHGCAALAVMIADDDVLWYALYRAGRVDHEYDSNPNYDSGPPAPPKGGNGASLAAAFGVPERAAELERVLRVQSGSEGYVFEHERHAELLRLLGLPEIAVATGYGYIEAGELPEGLEESDLRRVG
jgi:hypothetical protein